MRRSNGLSTVSLGELSVPMLVGIPTRDDVSEPIGTSLIARARAGDRTAFGQLLEQHLPAARRLALAAVGQLSEADEAVQEASVAAWQRLHGLQDPAAFRSWFLRIVWRKALDRRRSIRTWLERYMSPGADADSPDFNPASSDPSPDAALLGRELERAIAQVVRSLPRRLRDPFLLAASGDHHYSDIATLLSVPEGTVKWRISEARRLIRSKLDRLGYGVSK
jgi:RNA polymerase sigma factor (sigma-70 family)